MVRHHVAERARHFVELAAPLDADGLGHRDLHMIDAVTIPQRLEQPIGEAKRHDVLHRLLAEKMVDAEDLILTQRAPDLGVERAGRRKVMAERFLDHDAAPKKRFAVLALFLAGELRLAEPIDDGAEETIGDREVENHIAAGRLVSFAPRRSFRRASRKARAS